MTYHNAIKYIKNAPNLIPSKTSASARILTLLEELGNPQKRIKYIRLAGSNGKTVCARMLISSLNSAGIKNGCLSMPIHSEIRENIRINGEPITMDETVTYIESICRAVAKINEENEGGPTFRPTAHEILLCVALLAFTSHKCALCIIESDHNGEDTSRFLPAPLSVIICGRIPNGEKTEISKIRSYICRGIREIVSSPQNHEAYRIISDTCFSANCRLTVPAKKEIKIGKFSLGGTEFEYKGKSYSLKLCGKFQVSNAAVVIETLEMLSRYGFGIKNEHISAGLSNVIAPCKFELISISPTIIADSTHSNVAIGAICDSLADFKDTTGTKIRLCLPDGDLVPKYISALKARDYDILKISALRSPDEEALGDKYSEDHDISISVCKTHKLTAKDALAGLENDCILLITGPSNFTMKVRYELLGIMGF